MKPAPVQYTSGESYLLRAARFADPSQTPDMNSRAQASMLELHRSLSGHDADAENPAAASTLARLRLAGFDAGKSARGAVRCRSTPPLARTPIAPQRWPLMGFFAARKNAKAQRKPWNRSAKIRRRILLFLLLAQTYLATAFMAQVLPYHGRQLMEIAILALFAILIAWVSAGFWTAMAGLLILLRGRDRYAISATIRGDEPVDATARTAVIMPIYNEDSIRVFAGMRATYESVVRTGKLDAFDFFVLSDTNDPDTRIAERSAWFDVCRRTGGFGKIFYRLRRHRIKRKSGNVADFCRRWGKNYRYMIVLDADSVMSGDCLVNLVRMMEANADAGIIQTAPHASGRETLYARVQQFATHVYGPLFTAGMHYWQLGESHYWGHNAIIRVEQFMRYCSLERLKGRGALSGEILSHDFVEAALMRRAGWSVWLAYDLPGSFEEMPPNLIDELMRDRRWCQGNLINSRLFFTQGLHAAHRAVFFTGVMAYVSAPLWFVFLLLSTANLAVHTLVEPEYFTAPAQLFPLWPEWHPDRAIFLFTMTAMLLFLPKLASVALLLAAHKARAFGGTTKLAASMLMEFVFSALLAPIRMLFHTQFVVSSLLGWKITWKSPPRDDAQTPWSLAFRRHGVHTLIGLAWAAFVYWLNPAFLWWLLPVAGALALSIPISVFSSRVSLGRRARAARLFLIPEETAPPRELRRMRAYTRRATSAAEFLDAVVDPLHNAMACASDLARTRHSEVVRRANHQLVARALAHGPNALDADEKNALLGDAIALSKLHFEVWNSPDAHPSWNAAQEYRAAGNRHMKEAVDLQAADMQQQPLAKRAIGAP